MSRVKRGAKRSVLIPLLALVFCIPGSGSDFPAHQSAGGVSLSAEKEALVRVCSRPLPRWAGSKNWLLVGLNRLFVRHLHHSYVSFANGVFVPSAGGFVHTVGIHPVGASNNNKQPMLDQTTDNLDNGGQCKVVKDATPEKIQRLVEEIAADTCYSCGKNYHNRALSGCYNNSNSYVYDLIKEAGMTPPKMKGAPGYRHHHECHLW